MISTLDNLQQLENFKVFPSLKQTQQSPITKKVESKQTILFKTQKSLFATESLKQDQEIQKKLFSNGQTKSERVIQIKCTSPSKQSPQNLSQTPKNLRINRKLVKQQTTKLASSQFKQLPTLDSDAYDSKSNIFSNINPSFSAYHQKFALINISKTSRSPLYQNHVIIQPISSPQNKNENTVSSQISYDNSSKCIEFQNQSLYNHSFDTNQFFNNNINTSDTISNDNKINQSCLNKANNNIQIDSKINNFNKSGAKISFAQDCQQIQQNQNTTSMSKSQQFYKPNFNETPKNNKQNNYHFNISFQSTQQSRQDKNKHIQFLSQSKDQENIYQQQLNTNNQQNKQNSSALYQQYEINSGFQKRVGYISLSQRATKDIPEINMNSLNQTQSKNFLSSKQTHRSLNRNQYTLPNEKEQPLISPKFFDQKQKQQSTGSIMNQLGQIVNQYDERKYNLTRFNSRVSPNKSYSQEKREQNTKDTFQNSISNQPSSFRQIQSQKYINLNNSTQNIVANIPQESCTSQLVKRICFDKSIQRESQFPQNEIKTHFQTQLIQHKEIYSQEKSEQPLESKQLRLNGLSKMLSFSNNTSKIKEIKRNEMDVSLDLKGSKNNSKFISNLNSKIQQKVSNSFINKIGGIDHIQSSILKLNERICSQQSLQDQIVFDINNLDFQVFILHALGVKLIFQKNELQISLKNIGLTYKRMNQYKAIMRQYLFEETELIDNIHEVEFFNRLSRKELSIMKYTLLEKIGDENVLQKVAQTYHDKLLQLHPLYSDSGYTSKDIFNSLLYIITREDSLSTIQDYLQNKQKEFDLSHIDFYFAKIQLQLSLQQNGVLENPTFHLLEIFETLRPFLTGGHHNFPNQMNEQDKIVNEIASDIYKYIIDSKQLEPVEIEEKKDLTSENINRLVDILLRPYKKPYYMYISIQNSSKNNKQHRFSLESFIQSKAFPITVKLILQYISSTHQYSVIFNPFIEADIKQKLSILSFSSKQSNINYQESIPNNNSELFLLEVTPEIIVNSFLEYFNTRSQVKFDLLQDISIEDFKNISTSIFRFCLNQIVDYTPIRISAFDVYTEITQYKITTTFIEKLFKILWKILQVSNFPEFIIQTFYEKYKDFKEFLIFACNSQRN